MSKEVFFLIDNLGGGGAERVVSLLSNGFSADGYNVSIVTLEDSNTAYDLSPDINVFHVSQLSDYSFFYKAISIIYRWYYRVLRAKIIQPLCKKLCIHLPLDEDTYLFFYIRYAWPCRDLLKKHQGATAFAFLPPSAIALAIASKRLDIKTVFCERNYPLRNDMREDLRRLRDKHVRKYRFSVFQTETQKEYYDSIIGGEKRIILNPLKSDLPIPYIGKRSKRIVNFCRLNHQKNLPLLIRSFAEIHSNYPEYILEIYGTGPDENEVLGAISDNHVEDSVFVKPFSKTIHQDILDASMFVSTSDFEGLSNSMLEAMAIGLPCVCTDCKGGGARAVIHDGENGLLVPVGDKDAVVNAIKAIILNPEYAAKLGKNASKIREELSEERIICEWENLI